jgi:hypothetical protein
LRRCRERSGASEDRRDRAAAVATMGELVDGSLRRPRFDTLLVGSFAGLALLLGIVGIYGVTAAVLATVIPAWRAARLDLVRALRAE